MRQQLRTVFLLFFFLQTLGGCVSVKLSPEIQKSKGVSIVTLSSNFLEISLAPADRAWKSSRTGNTISYFSECSTTYIPLEQLRDDALGSLPKGQLIESKVTQIDEREALASSMWGKIEGINVKMSQLVYQKNGCRYSLSYTGREDQFDLEQSEFQKFIQGFHAP